MATYTKYEPFIQGFANKEYDLFGTTDTVNVVFHSDAPVVATDSVIGNLTQVTGTGYAPGDTQNDSTRSGGTVTATAVDFVWTAGAADWTSGRYVSTYDDTHASDGLINSWDYGSAFTLGNGETFTVDFGASWFTLS